MQLTEIFSRHSKALPKVALAAALLAGCQSTPAPAHVGDATEGRQVAEQLCATCHAIDPGKASPNPSAPPFTQVLERYGADSLTKDLDNAVPISHRRMPTFYLGEGHAEDLVAYLRSMKSSADSK